MKNIFLFVLIVGLQCTSAMAHSNNNLDLDCSLDGSSESVDFEVSIPPDGGEGRLMSGYSNVFWRVTETEYITHDNAGRATYKISKADQSLSIKVDNKKEFVNIGNCRTQDLRPQFSGSEAESLHEIIEDDDVADEPSRSGNFVKQKFELEQITVELAQDGDESRYLQAKIELYFFDTRIAKKLEDNLAELTHTIYLLLSNAKSSEMYTPKSRLPLKNKMQSAINTILGYKKKRSIEDGVTDIKFASIIVQ